jgi:hypothetical protein
MPGINGAALYQRLFFAWVGMLAVAMLYCLFRSIVDSNYVYIPGDTLKWTAVHWGAWPILLPVCLYLIKTIDRILSLAAGLIAGMFVAVVGASLFAYVAGNLLGWDSSLYGVTYHMAPIAAGTFVVFGVVVFWFSYQSAFRIAIDDVDTVDLDTVVLNVWKGQFKTSIDAAMIEWSRAARNYVELHAGGNSYLIRASMAEFERLLPRGRFLRTHRSYLVNTRFVVGIVGGSSRPLVILESGVAIPVGKKFRHAVLVELDQDSEAAGAYVRPKIRSFVPGL